MIGINDWASFVIGIVSGVIGSYLIYAVFHVIGNYAARQKLDKFFEKYGALKGVEYYEDAGGFVDNEEYKKEISIETQNYIGLATEHEKKMDAIVEKFLKMELEQAKEEV
jgi:hypothetical protein